ncbi:MAG: hypothetical protein LKF79_07660 [Solobacterium sp.]|jgi:predicted HicB family RNase H-like nuclease|nr:hypothetical protein [Solobacterium sp.]
MASTAAQKRASIKWQKDNMKRIPLDVSKPKYDEIKAAADNAGEAVNHYIKAAIDKRLKSGK